MFQMTTDVVTALKSVITRFGRDGIAKIKGENAFLAAKQLTDVAKSLACVDVFTDEAVGDVMDFKGFCDKVHSDVQVGEHYASFCPDINYLLWWQPDSSQHKLGNSFKGY